MFQQKVLPLIFLVLFLPTLTYAASPTTENFTVISAPETKLMMEENKRTVVINVLSALEFELQHIENSISIPVNELKGSPLLPKDKTTPIIFYCMGPR